MYHDKNGLPILTDAYLNELRDEKKGLCTGRCSTPRQSTLTPAQWKGEERVREYYSTHASGVKWA